MSASPLNAYRQTGKQATIHPVKLVHMMYERILTHLQLAEDAVRDENPGKRGENLGKAIALISELNSSVKQDDQSEAATFLRGLYTAIMVELPKVSISGDLAITAQVRSYIMRLKEIWEDTAMQENGFTGSESAAEDKPGEVDGIAVSEPGSGGRGGEVDGLSARLSVSI